MAALLSLGLTLTACTQTPLPDDIPRAVSVADPVSTLVTRSSARDLNVNARCTAVNMIVFVLVKEFGADTDILSDQQAAGALLINGTLAQFFQAQVKAELNRKGITGAMARRADEALFSAYIQAYMNDTYPANSSQRRAQSQRVIRDLRFCNETLAGLPV